MDSNSEDVDAKDAGATTPCGLLAAMDSAPAPTVTSLMKLRSPPNLKMDQEQEHKDNQVMS